MSAVKFARGKLVRQIMPAPIQGEVVRFAFSEQEGTINYLIRWTDAEGQVHERSFDEDQIELVPEPAPDGEDTPAEPS